MNSFSFLLISTLNYSRYNAQQSHSKNSTVRGRLQLSRLHPRFVVPLSLSLRGSKPSKNEMVSEEQRRTPQNQKNPTRLTNPLESGENLSSIFSPRFKSAAAMAGWDEEALLFASLVVEDTPDRDFKHKRRSDLNFKTPPPTNSRRYFCFFSYFLSFLSILSLLACVEIVYACVFRKRRAQRSPQPIPVAVLDLDFDEEETPREGHYLV